jgi:hypothetical protein
VICIKIFFIQLRKQLWTYLWVTWESYLWPRLIRFSYKSIRLPNLDSFLDGSFRYSTVCPQSPLGALKNCGVQTNWASHMRFAACGFCRVVLNSNLYMHKTFISVLINRTYYNLIRRIQINLQPSTLYVALKLLHQW